MRAFLVALFVLFFSGCAALEPKKVSKEEELARAIASISKSVDKEEAKKLAYEAINYSIVLADNYGVFFPAPIHNFLVNTGIKERGLCYEWAYDLNERLQQLNLKTLKILKVVADRGLYAEHNALVVTAMDKDYKDGILLDPWRRGGRLFWSKITEDPDYKWELR